MCEVAPIVWQKRLALMKCNRPVSGGGTSDYFLTLEDVESGRQLARFAEGYGLASALVHHGTYYAFASRFAEGGWNDVTVFKSNDMQHWTQKVALTQEKEHLFNTSVCAGKSGFVMAYESDDPKFTPFTVKFATSPDLENWTKLPDAVFGADRYAACPCIRYANGHYYLLYLEHRTPRWFFETCLARSTDLKHWELSAANPILTPGMNDGVNASDPDLIEFRGQTWLYYSVGDQRTWSKLRRAIYPGSMQHFFENSFVKPRMPVTANTLEKP
jgi:alpha-L-fucosidase